jgi:enoyl-CoA hydratase
VLSGRMMDAAEAERSGLVSRVVPLDRMLPEALALGELICALGTASVLAAKECVNRAYEGTLNDGLLVERRMFHALFGTPDQKEGMAAFLEKRKPSFRR